MEIGLSSSDKPFKTAGLIIIATRAPALEDSSGGGANSEGIFVQTPLVCQEKSTRQCPEPLKPCRRELQPPLGGGGTRTGPGTGSKVCLDEISCGDWALLPEHRETVGKEDGPWC